ncbi:rhomboid family protein [Nitzschia inconspicua]|uniref:Rhomboid family protein n=1 Tax=Nitzschia inconspicua TaxID=303405 RepID=A0A9K3L011_9STRA|nr:rhomboid family protein [Nitzschia inconspicua]
MTTRSTTSTNHALTAMSLLYLTVLVNVWIQQEPNLLEDLEFLSKDSSWFSFDWHSHGYTTTRSMFKSLFTHANWEHVLSNMFLLWMVGRQLFVASDLEAETASSLRWKCFFSSWTSPFCFLWIYFGSEVLAIVGCRFLSHLFDREWEGRVRRHRTAWSWQWVPDAWKDMYYTISNAQQVMKLRVWQNTPLIGSSAAVFGVIGAHCYEALCDRDHPAKMDFRAQMLCILKIGMELSRTPLSLDQISSLGDDDNIDHASHFCGFLGGFLLAAVWHVLSRKWRRHGSQHRYYETRCV